MAKSIDEIQSEIKALKLQQQQIRANAKEYEKLKNATSELNELEKVKLKLLEQENTTYQKNSKSLENLNKRLQYSNKQIKEAIGNTEDLDDIFVSVSNSIGEANDYTTLLGVTLNKTVGVAESIATELQKGGAATDKNQKAILNATTAYKTMQVSIAKINKQYIEGKISNEQRISAIKDESEAFQDVAHSVNMAEVNSEELKTILEKMVTEGKSFGKAMTDAQIKTQALDNTFGSFSGIPAMSEMNTLLKTNIKDTVAFKAAVFALGAALGKAAMDYFGAGIKAQNQAYHEQQTSRIENEAEIAKIQTEASFIPAKIDEERNSKRIESENQINELAHEAAFAAQKAAIQFGASMRSAAAEFNAASKTALFGNKLGGVGYGAAQLQMAGISADKIASAMQAAANATGKMPTGKMGADMAIMADRTGTSVDNIAQINEYFERTDKVSANVAMNMQEGLRNMADQAGLNLGKLMQEVADASKEALSYNIKSGPALAKQVAYAQSLGVSFGDIAKAGKNMVMNYKDSIKAEMQLSTLLGKQVDLSEVRAKFAEGDQEGALKALKEQGLQLEDMDMFQKQALQDSLGGLDLESISKVTTKEGTEPGALKAGNAGKANQEFMGKKVAAEASLQAEQAQISADTAIIDAKLQQQISDSYMAGGDYLKYQQDLANQQIKQAELAEKINQAWLNSPAYIKKLEELGKEDFKNGIREAIMSGFAMLAGGFLTTFISKFTGGLGKGISGIFGKLTGGGGAAPSGGGPSAPGGGGMPEGGVDSPGGVGDAAKGKGLIQKIFDEIQNLIKSIKGVVQEAITFVKDVGMQLVDTFTSILGKIIESINSLGGQVLDLFNNFITKIGEILTKGVDIVAEIGNKLAGGVMNIFNTIVKGLTQASGQLPTLLGNLGKALGAFFQGLGTGLAAFAETMAMPTALFGIPVGLIVIAMAMGIAAALNIAAPAIEKLTPLLLGLAEVVGGTFVEAIKAAGPVIEAVFDGIAKVIEAIGNAISSVISSITDSIAKLSGLDAMQMLAVAGGIAALAGAVLLFGGAAGGGGIMKGIGDFFGGDPVDNFKAFAEVDYNSLNGVANAVNTLSNSLGAFNEDASRNVADVMSTLNSQISDGFKEDDIADLGLFNSTLTPMISNLNALSQISPAIDESAMALHRLADAFRDLSGIDTKAIENLPWIKLIAFAAAGGSINLVQSANKSFNLTTDTAKKIDQMNTTTTQMLQVNKNLQALLDATLTNNGESGAISLMIDGRQVTKVIKRRSDNNQAQSTE